MRQRISIKSVINQARAAQTQAAISTGSLTKVLDVTIERRLCCLAHIVALAENCVCKRETHL